MLFSMEAADYQENFSDNDLARALHVAMNAVRQKNSKSIDLIKTVELAKSRASRTGADDKS